MSEFPCGICKETDLVYRGVFGFDGHPKHVWNCAICNAFYCLSVEAA